MSSQKNSVQLIITIHLLELVVVWGQLYKLSTVTHMLTQASEPFNTSYKTHYLGDAKRPWQTDILCELTTDCLSQPSERIRLWPTWRHTKWNQMKARINDGLPVGFDTSFQWKNKYPFYDIQFMIVCGFCWEHLFRNDISSVRVVGVLTLWLYNIQYTIEGPYTLHTKLQRFLPKKLLWNLLSIYNINKKIVAVVETSCNVYGR